MFRLVAFAWWLVFIAHCGIALFTMVAGSQGSVSAAAVWISWGVLVIHYFVRRRVLGRWLYRIHVQRARYWQTVNRDAAGRR
jgi:hypothetical protein